MGVVICVFSLSQCERKEGSTPVESASRSKRNLSAKKDAPSWESRGITRGKQTPGESSSQYDKQALIEAWRKAAEISGGGASQRYKQCELIREFASAGNFKEVLSFIVENSNPGDLRGAYLVALFTTPNDLPLVDLLSLVGSIEENSDRKTSLQALIRAMSTADVVFEFSDFSNLDPKTYGYSEVLKFFAADYLNRNAFDGGDKAVVNNFNEIASELDSLRRSKSIDDSTFYSTLSLMIDRNHVAATALVEWLCATDSLKNAPKELVIKAVSKSAANNGLAFLESLQETKITDESIWEAAFLELAKLDETSLKAWKRTHTPTDQKIQNAYSRALIDMSLKHGKYAAARENAQLINDPAERKQEEGKIWNSERDSLRKEIGRNPEETMQSIISGRSKYDEYWIEEAMATWISKDFDKAQLWYQDNWNKLPANKSQFLAAAFASQATGQGDMATARQWAAYIQDPKTKQRIEAGIAKAEAAKNK